MKSILDTNIIKIINFYKDFKNLSNLSKSSL